jgi:hypothetical protein
MTTTELLAQVTTTKNLIALRGSSIAMERPADEWVTSASGGQTRSGAPVLLAAVGRWFQHATTNDLQSATVEGDQSFVWGILVGPPGDDIQKGDRFTGPDGLRYEVRYVHTGTAAFETRAEVFGYEQ